MRERQLIRTSSTRGHKKGPSGARMGNDITEWIPHDSVSETLGQGPEESKTTPSFGPGSLVGC